LGVLEFSGRSHALAGASGLATGMQAREGLLAGWTGQATATFYVTRQEARSSTK
jgi:hypothetical protein